MSGTQTVFVDVREPDEYAAGHLAGAVNVPLSQLVNQDTQQLDHLPKGTPLVLYCRSGNRSGAAMNILSQLGYTNLTNGINQTQIEAKT